jgi:MFS family permease
MVTTIDPVVHGGRNRGYALVVAVHVLGATVAASAFGTLLGGLGALLGGPWRIAGPIAITVVAALYAVREGVGLPVPIPDRHRQVPEWWRTFYSPPVASFLYGLGLGIGYLTFLTFGTFVAVTAGAVASGSPALGALVCGPFGLARGLSILLASRRGGAATLDRLDAMSTTRGPRLVNAAALAAVAACGLIAAL